MLLTEKTYLITHVLLINYFNLCCLLELTEAEYASFLDKPIIPLKFDDCKATGLIARIINEHECYDVKTDELLKESLPKVKTALEAAKKKQTFTAGIISYFCVQIEQTLLPYNSKNTVWALQTNCKLLPFPLEKSCRNDTEMSRRQILFHN